MELFGKSDKGLKRENNEDNFFFSKKGRYAIVADGMGGHLGGEIASAMCTDLLSNFINNIVNDPRGKIDVQSLIESELATINKRIYQSSLDDKKLSGMGTTLSFLMEYNGRILYLNVGDSRIYQVRDKKITQITTDDSLVNELYSKGEITKEEQRFHPLKNVITRAIGTSSIITVTVREIEYKKNDCYILCSDGLSDMIQDEEILKVVDKYKKPERICVELINLANKYGGVDNITAVICTV